VRRVPHTGVPQRDLVSEEVYTQAAVPIASSRACSLSSLLCPPPLSPLGPRREFSNTGELQVIAPVESFQRKVAVLSRSERPTTTKAFWEGNTSNGVPAVPTAAAAGTPAANPKSSGASSNVVASSSSSIPPSVSLSSRSRSTFLQRFLRRHGPSVHHVAFLVPSLSRARKRFQSFGYTVYGYSDRDPLWKEFFLSPKQALGVVIQVAESGTLTPDMSWTASTAMLSQTHLTPVVKKHIAMIHEGTERWEPAAVEEERKTRGGQSVKHQPQVGTNATAASASVSSSASSAASTGPSTPASSAPSDSSCDSSAPSRLELLGLRMRCASEFKARRQWLDMFAANSCSSSVDMVTGVRTLCFRWAQSPMYIAVDIERQPNGWKDDSTSASAAPPSSLDSSPAPTRPGLDEKDSAQWDGPKWVELYSSGPVVFREPRTDREMGLDLEDGNGGNGGKANHGAATDANTASSPAAATTAPRTASTRPSSSGSSSGRRAPASSSFASTAAVQKFSPSFRRLPLDTKIMRSAFVHTSAPLPLPQPSTDDVRVKLVTVTAKEIKAKL
jgi:hypothetical protein